MAALTAPAQKVFTVLGTTDEVTTCDCCGRENLQHTIALRDNQTQQVFYYGSACGARAAGWTTQELNKQAKTADEERAAAIARRWHELTGQVKQEVMAAIMAANDANQSQPWLVMATARAPHVARRNACLDAARLVMATEFPGKLPQLY